MDTPVSIAKALPNHKMSGAKHLNDSNGFILENTNYDVFENCGIGNKGIRMVG